MDEEKKNTEVLEVIEAKLASKAAKIKENIGEYDIVDLHDICQLNLLRDNLTRK